MPRPRCCPQIEGSPVAWVFKPAGVPKKDLEEVVLHADEFEALRLADLEGQYHARAAEKMGISRQTFGRILSSARHKTAEALVKGCALMLEREGFSQAESLSRQDSAPIQ